MTGMLFLALFHPAAEATETEAVRVVVVDWMQADERLESRIHRRIERTLGQVPVYSPLESLYQGGRLGPKSRPLPDRATTLAEAESLLASVPADDDVLDAAGWTALRESLIRVDEDLGLIDDMVSRRTSFDLWVQAARAGRLAGLPVSWFGRDDLDRYWVQVASFVLEQPEWIDRVPEAHHAEVLDLVEQMETGSLDNFVMKLPTTCDHLWLNGLELYVPEDGLVTSLTYRNDLWCAYDDGSLGWSDRIEAYVPGKTYFIDLTLRERLMELVEPDQISTDTQASLEEAVARTSETLLVAVPDSKGRVGLWTVQQDGTLTPW